MVLTLRLVLLVVAVVLFAIAAVGIGASRVNLVALGLAFFAAAFLVGER
jgi:hypothetical protein